MIIKFLKEKLGGIKRSSDWPKFKKEYEVTHPKRCALCNTDKQVELHHIFPVSLFPEKELDPENVVWLCEKFSHHLFCGHLGSYRSYNKNVILDCKIWRNKILTRP